MMVKSPLCAIFLTVAEPLQHMVISRTTKEDIPAKDPLNAITALKVLCVRALLRFTCAATLGKSPLNVKFAESHLPKVGTSKLTAKFM